jgi:hypothetical protein
MEVVRAVIYMGFGTRSGLREEHGDGEFCFYFFVLESCEEGDAGPGLLLG